jgi:hypothetical protein
MTNDTITLLKLPSRVSCDTRKRTIEEDFKPTNQPEITMTNIQFLQAEVDEFLGAAFRVLSSVNGGAVDIYDQQGWYVVTLDDDEATLEGIQSNAVL